MTIPTSPSASGYLPPSGYKAPVIDGKSYTAPTTSWIKDANGNVVQKTTAGTGMEGLVGRNTSGKSASQFDGETFLKLLVAQMRYQDPSKPTDTAALMQQTATLSMVERINAMAASTDALRTTYASMLAEQRIASAVGIVGRKVEYALDATDPTKTAEGTVESVKFDGTGPILLVGGKNVPYNDVVKVLTAGSGSSGTTASGTTPTAGTTTGTTTGTTAGTTTGTTPA